MCGTPRKDFCQDLSTDELMGIDDERKISSYWHLPCRIEKEET